MKACWNGAVFIELILHEVYKVQYCFCEVKKEPFLHSPLLIQAAAWFEMLGRHWPTKSSYVTVARAFMLAATVLKHVQSKL